ncbi:expressed unknown protein [Seminavis robusta]|uniref:Transmembrane protein n=1 Tax=Seminavis robusta TaxID=568900 RepID=A0A9N8DR72_9STRA|nr:expressed unknown protein [Seminavis robusta]|eukprot:Sro297_g110940.1 n/a (565) ;mRNA; r:49850-51544
MPSPSSSSSVDRRRPGRSSSPPLTDPDGDTDTDTIVGTKSLYWFTALLWCAFFAAMIVLLLVLIRHQEALAKQADPTDSRPRLIPPKELARLVLVLRSNDYRLVRPHPTPATVAQQDTWCPPKMASLLLTLCASHGGGRRRRRSQKSRGKQKVSLQKRGMAAEAVALCLTNQPQYRDLAANATLFQNLRTMHKQLLVGEDDNNNDTDTTIELSLAKGLTDLLQQGITYYQKHQDRQAVTAMAQAAEAVWIASFHHPTHIHNFLKHNTIQVLGDIIVTNRPKAFQNGSIIEFPYRPAHAVMWACAALQNLAAHYCHNNGGTCTWEWQQNVNDNDNNPVLALKDRNDSLEQPELAHQARHQILAIPNLLETLAEWICFVGPIHAPINETYGWPGDAKLWKGLTPTTHSPHLRSPSIVPWAAAGVIKNLLLLLLNSDDDNNHKLRERLQAMPPHHPTSLPECLCRMKQHSPDWLERDKASDAVYFWGPPQQQQHVCGGSSDNEQDHSNYVGEQKDEVEQDDERGKVGVENVNKNGKEGDEGVEGGDARGDEVVTDEESDSKAPHEEL